MDNVQMRLGDVVMYGDSSKPPVQHGCYIVFNKLLGWWDGVGGTGKSFQNEFADGAWITPAFDEARTIVVEGHIWADDQPTLRDGIAWVKSQVPKSELGSFVAVEHERVSHVLVRRDGQPEVRWDGGLSASFSIQLTAPDSRILSGDGSTPYQHSATAFLPSTSGGLQVLGAEVLRTNLATNPSFESGVAGMGGAAGAAGSATVSVSSDWAASGTRSLKITGNGSIDYSGAYPWGGLGADVLTRMGVEAGKTYTVSADFYQSAVQTSPWPSAARAMWFGPTTSPSDAWAKAEAPNIVGVSRISCTFTIPFGTTGMNAAFTLGTRTGSGYYDNVLIEEGATAGTYFDGSTPNTGSRTYAWSGAPNDSASTESSVGGIQAPFQITASVVNGSVTVTAQGDAPPPVLVRINGPVVQPIIRDELGGQMPLDISLDAGQWLDVDLDARTIKINSTVNRRNLLRGPWITPRPGMVLSLDAAVYNPATSMTVFWTDASN